MYRYIHGTILLLTKYIDNLGILKTNAMVNKIIYY